MLHILEQVLDTDKLAQINQVLRQQNKHWEDGKRTAGAGLQDLKDNQQLSRQDDNYQALAALGVSALKAHPLFMSAALPQTIMPPLFSQYNVGQHYDIHVDNALQIHPDTQQWLRTDLSLTLFLNDPDEYEGGELIIQDDYGEHAIKLAAGDAILYPSTSLHRVNPIHSGTRLAMVTWIQSLVRSDEKRQILHDLDISHILLRQQLQTSSDDSSAPLSVKETLINEQLDKLNKSYHNLLRLWAEC